jgi:hypothetical protein
VPDAPARVAAPAQRPRSSAPASALTPPAPSASAPPPAALPSGSNGYIRQLTTE